MRPHKKILVSTKVFQEVKNAHIPLTRQEFAIHAARFGLKNHHVQTIKWKRFKQAKYGIKSNYGTYFKSLIWNNGIYFKVTIWNNGIYFKFGLWNY